MLIELYGLLLLGIAWARFPLPKNNVLQASKAYQLVTCRLKLRFPP